MKRSQKKSKQKVVKEIEQKVVYEPGTPVFGRTVTFLNPDYYENKYSELVLTIDMKSFLT